MGWTTSRLFACCALLCLLRIHRPRFWRMATPSSFCITAAFPDRRQRRGAHDGRGGTPSMPPQAHQPHKTSCRPPHTTRPTHRCRLLHLALTAGGRSTAASPSRVPPPPAYSHRRRRRLTILALTRWPAHPAAARQCRHSFPPQCDCVHTASPSRPPDPPSANQDKTTALPGADLVAVAPPPLRNCASRS